MSETVRTLIKAAYLRSTVRGLGDTPDDHETRDALDMLNEILDELCRKQAFSFGKESRVLDVPAKGYVTFSCDPHRTFMATDVDDGITCLCGDSHDLNVGDAIVVRLCGVDIETNAVEVISFQEFKIPSFGGFTGRSIGSFRLATDGEEFSIDMITPPPVNISQVVGSGEGELPEATEREFYATSFGRGWFYRKGNNPYPRLYVSGCRRVRIVYDKPSIRNVTLDTDLSFVDTSFLTAIKFRLAAEIAASNGFDAKEQSLLSRWKSAYSTFVRSMEVDEFSEPDTTMAGYDHQHYDIYTDGASNATF